MDSDSDNGKVTDIYREKYVAFLDLLGFKSLVSNADNRPENLLALLSFEPRQAPAAQSTAQSASEGMRRKHFD
jgi:hypothetical protein